MAQITQPSRVEVCLPKPLSFAILMDSHEARKTLANFTMTSLNDLDTTPGRNPSFTCIGDDHNQRVSCTSQLPIPTRRLTAKMLNVAKYWDPSHPEVPGASREIAKHCLCQAHQAQSLGKAVDWTEGLRIIRRDRQPDAVRDTEVLLSLVDLTSDNVSWRRAMQRPLAFVQACTQELRATAVIEGEHRRTRERHRGSVVDPSMRARTPSLWAAAMAQEDAATERKDKRTVRKSNRKRKLAEAKSCCHNAKRRKLDGDCPVCLEPLEVMEDLTWCRNSCGQSIHRECWDKHAEIRRAEGRTATCVSCRAVWSSAGCLCDEGLPA